MISVGSVGSDGLREDEGRLLGMNTPRAILGIETSCDETAVALVTREGRVLTSLVASQVDLHAAFGGVVPEVAARVHIQACLPLVERALSETATTWRNIEAVAVTYGPGLIGCLLVGIETAKTLAWVRGRPLVAVNHLAGHLHALQLAPAVGHHLLIEGGREFSVLPVALDPPAGAPASAPPPDRIARPAYPHVGLIVSGGHTSLVWVGSPARAETIAQTRDDAVGEAYDKVARVAGLGYPGGPAIDRLAATGAPDGIHLAPPMMRRDKPDFSFSGLKTAAGRELERLRAEHGGELPAGTLANFCAAFQAAAVEALLGKALDAVAARRAADLVITGGVACNRGLRRRAAELSAHRPGLRIWFPHPLLCTDNAAMIAGLAWHLEPLAPRAALTLNADPGLGI